MWIEEKKGRCFSFDETRFKLDMKQMGKSTAESIILAETDTGECLANKSGNDCTIVGGGLVDARALPALYILQGQSFDVDDTKDPPESHIFSEEPNGGPVKYRAAAFYANANGGMTDDLGVAYIKNVIVPCFPDISPNKPAIMVCDGHGSHITLELLLYAKEAGIIIVLRPPHTSHKVQGEDTQNFREFKRLERKAKANLLMKRILHNRGKDCSLKKSDITKITKIPWEKAFNQHNNRVAWASIGISPFNRRVYWKILQKERLKESKIQKDQFSFEDKTLEDVVSSESEDEDADPLISQATSSERRISSRDLWDKGPATRDESIQLIKERVEKRQLKENEAQEKKKQKILAEETKKLSMHQQGESLSRELEQSGKSIEKLTVDELTALLVYYGMKPAAGKKEVKIKQLGDYLEARAALNKQ
eukprot:Pompholyxophrys_punicea_v1_NODE_257_length_2508_cov_3.165919.p1 type:complete len:421 gc:universal NODE_257_length_2508_cov_3.165919:1356-94(-)